MQIVVDDTLQPYAYAGEAHAVPTANNLSLNPISLGGVAGELVVLIVEGSVADGVAVPAAASPSGWIKLLETPAQFTDLSAIYYKAAIYLKRLDGSESSVNFLTNSVSTKYKYHFLRFTGGGEGRATHAELSIAKATTPGAVSGSSADLTDGMQSTYLAIWYNSGRVSSGGTFIVGAPSLLWASTYVVEEDDVPVEDTDTVGDGVIDTALAYKLFAFPVNATALVIASGGSDLLGDGVDDYTATMLVLIGPGG